MMCSEMSSGAEKTGLRLWIWLPGTLLSSSTGMGEEPAQQFLKAASVMVMPTGPSIRSLRMFPLDGMA